MRIEICGGIASGKTTLASAIQMYFPTCEAIFEDVFSNGFLADFYEDTAYYAYETELFFVLQHMHQIKAGQRRGITLVCDFSMEQDFAYGKSNLAAKEWQSFLGVYQETTHQINIPNLIIFLECPTDVLLKRIADRGRKSEATINASYLNQSIDLLKNHLNDIGRNVVAIDSSKYDFRNAGDLVHLFSGPLSQYQSYFGQY